MLSLKSVIGLIAVAVAVYLSYDSRGIKFLKTFFNYSPPKSKTRLISKEELKLFNGIAKPSLYLSILGDVYDVTKGSKHYGPGQAYNFFVGKDASRNFISGKFTDEDLNDDIADLSNQELLSINYWVDFYRKSYNKVGVLMGRYYDDSGEVTPYGIKVRHLIKQAIQRKIDKEKLKGKFPPCNIEWNPDTGTHVWCTKKSGGIDREWVGVPRQLYEPGSKNYRCACVNDDNLDMGNLKEYEGCDKTSHSCYFKDNDNN